MWHFIRPYSFAAFLALAVWTSAAQSADLPPSSDPALGVNASQDLHDEGIFLCSQHLSLAVQKNGGQISSRTLMELRLTDPQTLAPMDWFQSQISKTIHRALQNQINLSKIKERGLKANEKYYLVQQLYLKELNEQLLDIGGTQYYLQALDSSLHTILESDPTLGQMVHVNYKDRVVVSTLSPEDFEARVLGPARNLTESYIKFLSHESGERVAWGAFLKRSLALSSGRSIEEAVFKLRLEMLGISESDWRAEIKKLRGVIKLLVRSDDDIPSLIKKFRRVENSPDMLELWEKKTFPEMTKNLAIESLRRYLQLLAVGDMLPVPDPPGRARRANLERIQQLIQKDPKTALDKFKTLAKQIPEAWAVHRSYFLRASLGKRIIISTDLKGLGTQALLAREAWVASGAKISDLPNIYGDTTAFMNQRHQALGNALRYVVGIASSVDSYVSGDDGLWSLPMLNPEKLGELRALLEKLAPDFYFHIEIVDETSDPEAIRKATAFAINNAWKALFQSKSQHKTTQAADLLTELQTDTLEGERSRDESSPKSPTPQ